MESNGTNPAHSPRPPVTSGMVFENPFKRGIAPSPALLGKTSQARPTTGMVGHWEWANPLTALSYPIVALGSFLRDIFFTKTLEGAELFEHLTENYADLDRYLRENPGKINDRDEDGRTLLHHAVNVRLGPLSKEDAARILRRLFSAPGVDFNIKDSDGNTPVQLVESKCDDEDTRTEVLPRFKEAAALKSRLKLKT